MNVGAVAGLRNIRDAVAVARHVMENTQHTLLVGDLATDFAVQMGFKRQPLNTPASTAIWKEWKQERQCQPNYWLVGIPDKTFNLVKFACYSLERPTRTT